ncbi:alpha/beta hydrolase [Pseudogracilibacillus sp. ICA-222130]|uniref:alpha/beta hydrolase n=1 Tax=Pseudogracilibacillus sp. ICA-222130 TaxID=3134655 RepID=UPI0030C0659D
MKIKAPAPFTFEAGNRAVLLLHGFTGNSADVRMLGRYLQKQGYTCYAPILRGHGMEPENLLEATPAQWWEDVQNAYEHLQHLGYEEIAVAGLSMGGVLGIKLATEYKVTGLITMCSPMFFDNEHQLTDGFRMFAKQYKQFERKDRDTIATEVKEMMDQSRPMFTRIKDFVKEVNGIVDLIYTPTMVVQARKDEMINPESANYIYDTVETDQKQIKWYEKSGHVITTDKEKEQLHEDIYTFLQSLNWEQ